AASLATPGPGDAATARLLLEALHVSGPSSAATAAEVVGRAQAAGLGVAWQEHVPAARHALPGEALRELAARHGATPTPAQERDLAALDALDEPLRGALTRTVDAFLDLDAASRAAFAAPAAGAVLPDVLAARAALVEAIGELRDARIAASKSHAPTLQMPPVFSIDLENTPDAYAATEPFVLVIDAGGSDLYLNNAGGNNLGAGNACPDVLFSAPPPSRVNVPATALVDLGNGDDRYGSAATPRSCGANGGAVEGVGLLLDEGGNDTYLGGGYGVNGGGAFGGIGALLDLAGNDAYSVAGAGTNGGGSTTNFGLPGVGFLLDLRGNDTYSAYGYGVNGGAYGASSALQGGSQGFLVDGAGDDVYDAGTYGTRGVNGGAVAARGFLLDRAGNDTYLADDIGVNGGAITGTGFLLDGDGNDEYAARGANGVNGGASQAVALLLDARGFDSYQEGAGPACANTTDPSSCVVVPKGTLGAQLDADCRLVFSPTVCGILSL
ncbi:MAG TPA: hypothetical protein VHH36_05605, partial [Candidatus Thermoplasmatota archaeon]|nr:hypothetical protein [Candidatus Thermoplasmatota archaeon]